ncbi:ABC transporter permease [Nonomuraea sp. K274]|uniref:Transport permease protein n=1 Tax=Nonomuraea cypriaca TaxID=1187855 RepID=A0A931EYB1_9ACTN|nr:ABC transporter permease [Nonomuraea cypriaca]MBF8185031.1 ABC transporter permease [Nonomuraea cypriaca]
MTSKGTARAFAHLSTAELTLLARDPGSLFFMVAFPLMLLMLRGDAPKMETYVAGYMGMILAIGGIATLPGIVATYRERKVLRRLATTPISPFALLTGQVVAQLVMGIAGAAVIVCAGMVVFDVPPPAHPVALALAFLLCALMNYSVGFLIAAVAPRARTAHLAGLMVMFPMIFLAGAAVPREFLPEAMRGLGDYLPLTPAVVALRESWSGTPSLLPLLLMAGIIAACTAVAAALFRWE